MPNKSDRKIARNTSYLYGSMILTMAVSLYTVRVVFDTLGVEDYGVYNVVGGLVAIFNFLMVGMSGAVSRFLNFELGQGNPEKLGKVFRSALAIHVGMALMVLILGETIGLWYVNNHLVIAPERMTAANWVFQFSLFSVMVTIVQSPYIGDVISHERLGFHSFMSVVHALLKLGAALGILLAPSLDNLIVYAALMAATSVIIFGSYYIFCSTNFKESKLKLDFERKIVKEMLVFCGWDTFMNFANTTRIQGIILILNKFGGTVLNAAGGITLQVSGAVTSFSQSLLSASRPQIIQEYSRRNYDNMLRLFNNCARYCTFLMGLVSIPLIIEMDYVLEIWLKDPAPYTAVFCRLALLSSFGDMLNTTVIIGIHATGYIKRQSILTGIVYLVELPCMYFLLQASQIPAIVYCVHLVFIYVIVFVNTLVFKHQLSEFRISVFWYKGIILPGLMLLAAFAISYSLSQMIAPGFVNLLAATALSTVSICTMAYFLAFDKAARADIKAQIKQKLSIK